MKRLMVVWAALALGFVIAAGHPPSADAKTGGRFILLDTNNKVVTDSDFHGKFLLMFFGYTFCPDICPTSMQDVAEVLDQLGKDIADVKAVFISVDPERDTPAVIDEYIKNFDERIIGLTGSKASLDSITRKYRITVKKVEEKPGDPDYTLDHTASILLISPAGEYIRRFGFKTPPADIVKVIRKYLVR